MIVIVHFLIGSFVSLMVFLLFARLAGERRFSFPVAAIFIGLSCAVLAHFLTPWATPAVLLLYVVASVGEYRRDREALRKMHESDATKQGGTGS